MEYEFKIKIDMYSVLTFLTGMVFGAMIVNMINIVLLLI